MISMHTSPLEQPGIGDAGGMNVYVLELARQLAGAGTEVDIFTRATRSAGPSHRQVVPGVVVRNVPAGPIEGLAKADLPAQLRAFAGAVLRENSGHPAGDYDAVHSHYWLSGEVGRIVSGRWGVPLVHTAHTLGRIKNTYLADEEVPEPLARLLGEERVAEAAHRLVASTQDEAAQLVELYGADPAAIRVIPPGVDLDVFRPGDTGEARSRLDIAPDALLLAFVGRLQPLKAPDVLIRAAAVLVSGRPELRERLVVAIVGGPSGNGLRTPDGLQSLAVELGIGDLLRLIPPMPATELVDVYRAADLVVVPSYNESFGLVALEAQACGTPVVAAAVGGLRSAVVDGRTGALVAGHDPAVWAAVLGELLDDPARRAAWGAAAARRAAGYGWHVVAARTAQVYDQVIAELASLDQAEQAGLPAVAGGLRAVPSYP